MNEYKLEIVAGKSEKQYMKDLWEYRELMVFLAWRDVLVRYKQTVIGVLWAVIRPFLTMIVFTVVFGTIAKLPSNGIPYPILVYSAMLPWQFFASALQESSNSLIANSSMISKIYFPRIIVPISSMLVSLLDFLIAFIILIGLMIFYGYAPPIRILVLPLLTVLAFFTGAGIGLLFSALNVKYRDFRYIIPFAVQLGLYVSPVGFLSSIVPAKYQLLYSLNPMVGVIDSFRWAIIGNSELNIRALLITIIISSLLMLLGVWYFRRTEKTFADVI